MFVPNNEKGRKNKEGIWNEAPRYAGGKRIETDRVGI